MPIPFERPEVRERLFGGDGLVRVESLEGALTAPFTAALHCELSPRGSVGRHRQEHDDEIVIALEGDAVVYVDAKPNALVPGAMASVPLGAVMEIVNASVDAPFRYLIVKARRA
jgi:quercetin dioxygenase-like cupin family protein